MQKMQINDVDSSESNSQPFLPFTLPSQGKISFSDPSQSFKFLSHVSFLKIDKNAFKSIVLRFWSSVTAVSQQDLDSSITPQSLSYKFIATLVEKGLSKEIVKNKVFSFSTRKDDSNGLLFVDIPDLPGSLSSDSENVFKVLCVSEAAMKFEANLFFVLRCFGVKMVNFCILNLLLIFVL